MTAISDDRAGFAGREPGVRVAIGLSRLSDITAAVIEAAANADRRTVAECQARGLEPPEPSFAVIVATPDRFADVAAFERGLRESFAGLPHAGGSTARLGTPEGFFGDGMVAVLLASGAVDARAFAAPAPRGGDLGSALDALEGDVSTVVAFADPRAQQGALLPRLLERLLPGVVLAGGGTTGTDGSFQVCNGQVLTEACTGLAVRLPAARAGVFVAQGGELIGRRATVTASDGGALLEIDGEPATALLDALSPESLPGPIEQVAPMLALAVAPGGIPALEEGHFVVRHLTGVDPKRKSINVAGRLEPGFGVSLVLREAIGVRNHVKRQAARLGEALGGTVPSGGLYFDCASRGERLYGSDGVDEAQVRRAIGDVPLLSLQSAFELGPLWVGAHVRPEVHLFSGVLWTLADS